MFWKVSVRGFLNDVLLVGKLRLEVLSFWGIRLEVERWGADVLGIFVLCSVGFEVVGGLFGIFGMKNI